MATRSVRYVVVDAFTDIPFKGNPAAVCLLEEEVGVDDNWMQNVAKEFNVSQTAFLMPSAASIADSGALVFSNPRFRLRWFTPVEEVSILGIKMTDLQLGDEVGNYYFRALRKVSLVDLFKDAVL